MLPLMALISKHLNRSVPGGFVAVYIATEFVTHAMSFQSATMQHGGRAITVTTSDVAEVLHRVDLLFNLLCGKRW